MQSRWVQEAEKARSSVSESLTTITGSAPKWTILNPFSTSSGSLTGPTSTSEVEASGMRGGLTYRRMG